MKDRLKIYVSGPLTTGGCEVLDNVENAIQATRALIELGYAPLCPHLTYYVDPNAEIPHEQWMEVDLPWVRSAHALLRLPGASTGSDIECAEARRLCIPIFYSIEKLHAAYAGK